MTNVLDRAKRLHRVIGRIRLALGFCPRCNSDAPHVDSCAVCKSVYEDNAGTMSANCRQCYPPNLATRALWWYEWMRPGFEESQSYWEMASAWKARSAAIHCTRRGAFQVGLLGMSDDELSS